LVEVEALNGTWRRFLLDTGWNPAWMEYSFQREGIDDMLRKGDIEFLYVSHEHMDHFWGLPITVKYRPNIKVMVSNRYYPEGRAMVQKSGHKGELVELEPGKIHKLFPGCPPSPLIFPFLFEYRENTGSFSMLKTKDWLQ